MALSTVDRDEGLAPVVDAEPAPVSWGDALLGAVASALVYGVLAAVSLWGWCETGARRVTAAIASPRSSR